MPIDLTHDLDSDDANEGSIFEGSSDANDRYVQHHRNGHQNRTYTSLQCRTLPSRQPAPFRPRPAAGLSQAYDPFADDV